MFKSFYLGGWDLFYFKLFYLLTPSRKISCEENVSWLRQRFKACGLLQDQRWSSLIAPPSLLSSGPGKPQGFCEGRAGGSARAHTQVSRPWDERHRAWGGFCAQVCSQGNCQGAAVPSQPTRRRELQGLTQGRVPSRKLVTKKRGAGVMPLI